MSNLIIHILMLTRYVILVAWLLLLTKSKIYDCLIHQNTPTEKSVGVISLFLRIKFLS